MSNIIMAFQFRTSNKYFILFESLQVILFFALQLLLEYEEYQSYSQTW